MKLCNETITVYNARLDRELDATVYVPTIINGVSWYGSVKSTVDASGLKAANQYTVRIPLDADMGGKSYTDAGAYKAADDVTGLFTLNEGDFIVKGAFSETLTLPPSKSVGEFFTILAATDNRRAPKSPHWKVTGA